MSRKHKKEHLKKPKRCWLLRRKCNNTVLPAVVSIITPLPEQITSELLEDETVVGHFATNTKPVQQMSVTNFGSTTSSVSHVVSAVGKSPTMSKTVAKFVRLVVELTFYLFWIKLCM